MPQSMLCGYAGTGAGKLLTFDFERMPLEPSIHTYSAMTLPLWGRERYFWSCKSRISKVRRGTRVAELTLAVLEMIVEEACKCCEHELFQEADRTAIGG
jgi:hypothetical protein